MQKNVIGNATRKNAKRVSILKLIDNAPIIIKKIEPGPSVEESNITH